MTSIRWSSITFTCFCLLQLQLQPSLASPTANSTLITPSTQSKPSPNIIPSSSSSTSSHQFPIGWFTSDRLLNKLVNRHLSSQTELSAHQKQQTPHSRLNQDQTRQHLHQWSPRHIADAEFRNNSLSAGAISLEHSHDELLKILPEAHSLNLALVLIPAFIVSFGFFSAFIKEKLDIAESIISVFFGILLGPYVTGLFDPRSWNDGQSFNQLTLELSRIVIALSVFAVGLDLPRAYMFRHWRSLAWLIGPAMLFGWLISGALIYALVPALTFVQALVVSAAVTPTDPVLAPSVVGKSKSAQKHVPAHLRYLLQAESGCNDGAAFPFLYLSIFLLIREETSIGSVIGKWLLLVVLYQVILGTFIGIVVGILARKILKFCNNQSLIDKESMVAIHVALALLTTGVAALAGCDDLLAAFACGTAFAWDDWYTDSIEASNFAAILDVLINCTTFLYIGATIPFSSWNDPTLSLVPWKLVVLGISIMLLRRLPIVIMLQRVVPDLKTHREAIFSGHFGPIGVGAIFVSSVAISKLPTPQIPPQTSLDVLALTAQSLIYLLVLFSVTIHGLSIPLFVLARKLRSSVPTMTRTLAQASGRELSWSIRTKALHRSPPSNDLETPRFELKELDKPLPVAPNQDSTDFNQSNQQRILDESTMHGVVGDHAKIRELSDSQPGQPLEVLPSLSAYHNPEANNRPTPPVRASLLRLGSRIKRTTAEGQAEKITSDLPVRPDPSNLNPSQDWTRNSALGNLVPPLNNGAQTEASSAVTSAIIKRELSSEGSARK
ncbi:Superoxide dismutase [Mn], mitochondrial [Puccinia graminis f. sp. tritici]|uniref:Superoxide dismutase [Mn], mitochondrial n=1 Tax=Puccinia graminis f. sp. tritici TaxID=56615 RepID=A0A5B0MQW7_PUCGR|nr:Superoxide dismutase [Mn], mitochondrial [Puccinia graminis f. sp. tritici]